MSLYERDTHKTYGYDPYNSILACVVWANVLEALYLDAAQQPMVEPIYVPVGSRPWLQVVPGGFVRTKE